MLIVNGIEFIFHLFLAHIQGFIQDFFLGGGGGGMYMQLQL